MNYKQILICPNAFKESLSSVSAAVIINNALKKINKNFKTNLVPLGDGGDGTLDGLIFANHKIKKINVYAHNPLNKKIKTYFGYLKEEKKVFIEMAKISGLALLKPEDRNPLKTTTFGLGELLNAALKFSPKEIYIGIGGSATNDGGMGMLQALGVKFIDKNNNELFGYGENLIKVKKIILNKKLKNFYKPKIIILSDVKNKLLGKDGASFIFAPQKGASKKEVLFLENGMKNYAQVVAQTLKKDFAKVKGSGAAGGMGFALNGFLKADMQSGLKTFSQLTNLEEKIKTCDIIITGEGKFDAQTLYGKAPFEIYLLAQKYNKKVFIFAGKIEGKIKLKNLFTHQITPENIRLKTALKNANLFLSRKVKEVFANNDYTDKKENR